MQKDWWTSCGDGPPKAGRSLSCREQSAKIVDCTTPLKKSPAPFPVDTTVKLRGKKNTSGKMWFKCLRTQVFRPLTSICLAGVLTEPTTFPCMLGKKKIIILEIHLHFNVSWKIKKWGIFNYSILFFFKNNILYFINWKYCDEKKTFIFMSIFNFFFVKYSK